MLVLAEEYDRIRINMPPGHDRTVAMNGLIAQMRTLGSAAKPWLRNFSDDQNSAGVRLCAIAILQLQPDFNYVDWLGERFKREQPFIFFQASIALMEMTRAFGARHKQKLSSVTAEALETVKSFKKGIPDQNSIDVLETILNLLENPSDRSQR
jgi:hypothetical protein